MRYSVLLIFLLSSSIVFAKGERLTSEIAVKDGLVLHKYILWKNDKKKSYKLVFKKSGEKAKVKSISKSQAEFIENESTRIIWKSKYRKPAMARKCSRYAIVHSGAEKAEICVEHRVATGMAYGLLNSVSQIFR